MTFRTRIRSLPVLALLTAPSQSHAQLAEHARVAVGTRMLVRTRDGMQGERRFDHAAADSLTVRRPGRDSDELLSLPWSETERVDTMAIARPSVLRMLLGSAVGGLIGLAVSYAGAALAPCDWDGGDFPAFGFIILAPAIIGTGIVTGGTVGYRHRDWHWSTAWRAPSPPPSQAR